MKALLLFGCSCSPSFRECPPGATDGLPARLSDTDASAPEVRGYTQRFELWTDASDVVIRARSRDRWWGMPALGTEEVDPTGVRLLEAWIRGL